MVSIVPRRCPVRSGRRKSPLSLLWSANDPKLSVGHMRGMLRGSALEHEAGSRIGAQQVSWYFSLREFVEHLSRAVQRNNVIDIHFLKRCNRLAHVIVI